MLQRIKALKNYKPKYFDVSLRDGLQTNKKILSLDNKKTILNNIIDSYSPNSIEIGSVVSSKVLPQMSNSIDLFKYAKTLNTPIDYYLLVPNKKYLDIAMDSGVNNFSLITSISNSFQKKNINKNLDETKKELDLMITHIQNNIDNCKIKLYISCINECPIDGKLDNILVKEEIQSYLQYNLDEFCLSDTCGTLTSKDFVNIVDNLNYSQCDKLSLHLHYSEDYNLMRIINYCIDKGIYKYDVSFFEESGGCSVTMDNHKINHNLNYKHMQHLIDNTLYLKDDQYICGHSHLPP